MSRIIFRTLFGSHIYGTNTPSSDTDYKSVFIPDARDIVLQRAAKHILNNTKEDSYKRNSAEDVDDESFSIQKFTQLLCEGQTVSLDMLFTPKEFYTQTSEEWEEIKKNKDKFLHKGVSSFIGYTKQQAAKYGVKGFRVRALKDAIDYLSQFPEYTRIKEIDPQTHETWLNTNKNEHITVVMCKGPNNTETPHLSVCNRKIPYHSTIKYAVELLTKLYDEYGHRALLAEKNEGIDWKALMHAVRVANEAKELLMTGNIAFPRPEKDLLLKIRKGELPYKEVEVLIEQGLNILTETQQKSTLPEKPDFKFIEDMVFELYLKEIKKLNA